jgi:hypothetical protein
LRGRREIRSKGWQRTIKNKNECCSSVASDG